MIGCKASASTGEHLKIAIENVFRGAGHSKDIFVLIYEFELIVPSYDILNGDKREVIKIICILQFCMRYNTHFDMPFARIVPKCLTAIYSESWEKMVIKIDSIHWFPMKLPLLIFCCRIFSPFLRTLSSRFVCFSPKSICVWLRSEHINHIDLYENADECVLRIQPAIALFDKIHSKYLVFTKRKKCRMHNW